MAEHTDPARELVRRAFEGSDPFDAEGGLADVVRRAGRPQHDDGVIAFEPRRRTGRRFAVVGTFAAAVVTILAVYAASAGTRPQQEVGAPSASAGPASNGPASNGPASNGPASNGPASNRPSADPSTFAGSPGTSQYASSVPKVLPSSCAASWVLEFAGKEIKATRTQGVCPPIPIERLWILDAARGNGLVNPGDARIWPLVPIDGRSMAQPPVTFRGGGWPGPISGHTYEVLYLDEAAAKAAKPGDDAYPAFETAHFISLSLIA
jgi:hypothetical protein